MTNLRAETTALKPSLLEEFERRCFVCHFDVVHVLQVHHVVPLALGGANNLGNLVVLCPTCHAVIHECMRVSRVILSGAGPYSDEMMAREYMDWAASAAQQGTWTADHDDRLWFIVHRGMQVES